MRVEATDQSDYLSPEQALERIYSLGYPSIDEVPQTAHLYMALCYIARSEAGGSLQETERRFKRLDLVKPIRHELVLASVMNPAKADSIIRRLTARYPGQIVEIK